MSWIKTMRTAAEELGPPDKNSSTNKRWHHHDRRVLLEDVENEPKFICVEFMRSWILRCCRRSVESAWKGRRQQKSLALRLGTSRRGLGRIRYVEVKWLWLQQAVADRRFRMTKVAGTKNPADILTKYKGVAGLPGPADEGGPMFSRSREGHDRGGGASGDKDDCSTVGEGAVGKPRLVSWADALDEWRAASAGDGRRRWAVSEIEYLRSRIDSENWEPPRSTRSSTRSTTTSSP